MFWSSWQLMFLLSSGFLVLTEYSFMEACSLAAGVWHTIQQLVVLVRSWCWLCKWLGALYLVAALLVLAPWLVPQHRGNSHTISCIPWLDGYCSTVMHAFWPAIIHS